MPSAAKSIPLLLAITLSLVAVIYPTFDYDLYWHLANGREMWAQGRIIETDIFSFTRAGTAYRNPEWLAQLILYGIWAVAGMAGLFAFKLVATLAVVLLAWRTLAALGTPAWGAALLIPLAVLTGFYRYIERPELFSLLGTAAVVAIILCSREGTWPRRTLYLLPPLLAVWEWLHGAVFGMALVAGAVLAENLAFRWRPTPTGTARTEWRRTLNLAVLATLILSLINPYGLRNYGIFLPVVANAAGFSQVNEWGSAGLRDYWLFFLLLGAGVLTMVRQRKIEALTETLWTLGFGILAWRYSRATGVFAIAALPWLGLSLGSQGQARVRQWLWLGGALLLAAGIYVHKFSPWSFAERRFGWTVLEAYLPAGSTNFALDQKIPGNLYNTGHFGGYLAFALPSGYRIFQYNLPKVWGETYTDDPGLPDRYAINWAITGRQEELRRMFPRSQWAYVFMDGASVLALRRSPENADFIREFEVLRFSPAMSPQRLAAGMTVPPQGERLAFEAAVYCAYRANPALCAPLQDYLAYAQPAWKDRWQPRIQARQGW